MAARIAQMVRALQLAAVRAFLECFSGQRIMAAAHTALRGGSFPFGDSHLGTYSISKYNEFLRAIGQSVHPDKRRLSAPDSSLYWQVKRRLYAFLRAMQGNKAIG